MSQRRRGFQVMMPAAWAGMLVAGALVSCGGEDAAGQDVDTRAAAEALTQGLAFERGGVVDAALVPTDVPGAAFEPSPAAVGVVPGEAGVMSLTIGAELPDDPVVGTLIRFGDLEQFITVMRDEADTDATVDNSFQASPELCASLCNTTYSVPVTEAPLTASGGVGEHQQRTVELDCTELGDPGACGESGLAPPTDYDREGCGYKGWGYLVPPGLQPSIDAPENIESSSVPQIGLSGYLSFSATFRPHEEDGVSHPDATVTVEVIVNAYPGYEGEYELRNATNGAVATECTEVLDCGDGNPCELCYVDESELILEEGEGIILFYFQGWAGIDGHYASNGTGELRIAATTSAPYQTNVCFRDLFIAGISPGTPGLGNQKEPYSGGGPHGAWQL